MPALFVYRQQGKCDLPGPKDHFRESTEMGQKRKLDIVYKARSRHLAFNQSSVRDGSHIVKRFCSASMLFTFLSPTLSLLTAISRKTFGLSLAGYQKRFKCNTHILTISSAAKLSVNKCQSDSTSPTAADSPHRHAHPYPRLLNAQCFCLTHFNALTVTDIQN